ncbi:hypothetical protein BGZ91_008155, partial [Linnemannia elongata]
EKLGYFTQRTVGCVQQHSVKNLAEDRKTVESKALTLPKHMRISKPKFSEMEKKHPLFDSTSSSTMSTGPET